MLPGFLGKTHSLFSLKVSSSDWGTASCTVPIEMLLQSLSIHTDRLVLTYPAVYTSIQAAIHP